MERERNALRSIMRNDRSATYEYGEARPSDGEDPPKGSRWNTPRETAESLLRESGGLVRLTDVQRAEIVAALERPVRRGLRRRPDPALAALAEALRRA